MEFDSLSGTNTVALYFRSMLNNFGYDETADNEVVSDSVAVNLKDTATAREFREEFYEAIDSAKMKLGPKFLVIGDDLSTDTRYFSSLVSNLGQITIKAAGAE
jgi:hypothetical protein